MGTSGADWIGFPGARGIGEEETAAVERVLKRRTLYRGAGLAPPEEVEALERELAAALGRRYALTLNSGTSALVAALKAMNVRPGDEVVLPTYGWLTDVSAVLEIGAVPVFAPITEDLELDAEKVSVALTDRTKAVVAIGACGLACDIGRVREACGKRNVRVLEDACQSLGARRDSEAEQSDASVLSFQAFKIVTGGEGGAFLTDDEALYRAALCYHDAGLSRFATSGERSLRPIGIGLNLRMSEIAAALVRVQLRRLPLTLDRLRDAHEQLAAAVAARRDLGVRVRRAPSPSADNCTFLVLTCTSGEVAEKVRSALLAKGCAAQIASNDELHCLTGWREYLTRERFEHRVVDVESSMNVLERTLTVQVNWQRAGEQLEALKAVLDRAGV